MEIRYDHVSDAMYIKLIDRPVFKSKRVTLNLNIDLDEQDAVIGIEVISVRTAGIDPLTMAIVHVTTAENVDRPDQEAIQQGRFARVEAMKRQKEESR
jgi:uncharacterized protein YuzE